MFLIAWHELPPVAVPAKKTIGPDFKKLSAPIRASGFLGTNFPIFYLQNSLYLLGNPKQTNVFMNKITLGSLLLLSAISYSQAKFEKGAYVTNAAGQKIKLNLKENNKYELVFFYGDYEVKNDTVHFKNNNSSDSEFAVKFSSDANPSKGKVKVKITGDHISYYYSSLHFGTQTGKSTPVFKSFSSFSENADLETNELTFEVNREEFFYLAKDDYDKNAQILKFSLPRDANEILISYSPNYLGKMELQGYINDKKELVVVEKGKAKLSPLAFRPEIQKEENKEVFVKPIEIKSEANWTYAGKSSYNDYDMAVDSVATPATSFKLTVQENLQKALDVAKKSPEKFLVISYDPDGKNSKSEFTEFIKNQEYSIGTYMSYEYVDKTKNYDKYQFYNATAKDKSWAVKNKISDNPSTIVLDSDGTVLSQTKGSISQNQYSFDTYSNPENLLAVKAISDLNKALNSKAKEAEILKKLLPLSDSNSAWSIYPPLSAQTSTYPAIEEVKAVAVDSSAVAYPDYYAQNETVYTKIDVAKKKLLAAWEAIVEKHAKDTKPNMDFVKVTLSEIQNRGFYYQIYNEERVYDEVNFKAIDYLINHYDAILKEQQKEAATSDAVGSYADVYNNIEWVLSNAIAANGYLATPETSSDYQKRLMAIYKRIIEKQSDNLNMFVSYFGTLDDVARNSSLEQEYVLEYDAFFAKNFNGQNDIQSLDEMYSKMATQGGLSYNDWLGFKNSFSNMSNQAAWFVVEKSANPESIKKAIKWSESSLRIEKNNAYYLDTLAQLYYKNGEKQKAISTQELAIKHSENMEEETKSNLQNVLQKMKNGTY